MDSNHRPHPCQGCALTRLSYGPTWMAAVSILTGGGRLGQRWSAAGDLVGAARYSDRSRGAKKRFGNASRPAIPRPQFTPKSGRGQASKLLEAWNHRIVSRYSNQLSYAPTIWINCSGLIRSRQFRQCVDVWTRVAKWPCPGDNRFGGECQSERRAWA